MKFNQIVILVSMAFIGRIVLTILHELGHGIVAAIFTRHPVTLFFGSYGKTSTTIRVPNGRFIFHFQYNIFKWHGGMCQSDSGAMSYYQYVMFIIAGPIFPFVIAITYFYTARIFDSENIYVTALFFLIMATFSLIYNLIPKKNPITLSDGGITYNDGNLLQTAIRYRHIRKEYCLAIQYYNDKRYSEAAEYFKFLVERGMNEEHIYRLMLYSFLLADEFDNIKSYLDDFMERYELSELDHINFGYYYSKLGDHDLAMEYYQKSLKMKDSWHAHNNIGYTLNIRGNYHEAILHFDKAILIDSAHAYAYNNRGLAKIKIGNTDEGLEDMQRSFSIDPENSYYFKNMGTYYFDRKEYAKALEYFETAFEKNPATYRIKDDIAMTKELLNQQR